MLSTSCSASSATIEASRVPSADTCCTAASAGLSSALSSASDLLRSLISWAVFLAAIASATAMMTKARAMIASEMALTGPTQPGGVAD